VINNALNMSQDSNSCYLNRSYFDNEQVYMKAYTCRLYHPSILILLDKL